MNDEVPQITGQFTVSIDEEQPVGTVLPITMNVVDGDAADTGALIYSISGKIFYLYHHYLSIILIFLDQIKGHL